jgi:ferredoxin
MAYVIAEPCVDVKDGACLQACPVNCIYQGSDQLYINPDECIDCGACDPVCPVNAIFSEGELPDKWRSYVDKNAAFFGIERRHRRGASSGG